MDKYDSIINLPHRKSTKRAHMSRSDRAAQFAPFAALTGYGDTIKETARLTESKIELSQDSIEEINATLCKIVDDIKNKPIVTIVHFVADERKSGGAYVATTGNVIGIDEIEQKIMLNDKSEIMFEDILEISYV